MSKSYTIVATKRDRAGKGSSRALRKDGQIPAVIYGNNEDSISIAVPYKDIYYKIYGGGFLTNIANIEVDGQTIQALPKAYQLDPVRDFPIHVDFLRVNKDSVVSIKLPIHFLNEDTCPGIKRGGVLNIVHHELECSVPASNIPHSIEIDLKGYEIGSSIHLTDINLPEGAIAITNEKDLTIATISTPSGGIEEPEAVAE